ncbi:MAG: NYN domain-containing protein [Chloroflexi bacterium]|nr:NYN domain-containing protein [Chloroflexota bacterium]
MPLLIDGHNLIGQSPDLKLSDPNDEAKLIHRLKQYAIKVDKQITVIFDNGKHADFAQLWDSHEQHGKVNARWAPSGRIADDVIRDIVGGTKDRRGLMVITSDGAVASFVRACGVRVQSSAEFVKELQKVLGEKNQPIAKPANSSTSEIDEWLKVFKEPATSRIEPLPFKDPISEVEKKRLRRMEQLRKQTRGGGRLS